MRHPSCCGKLSRMNRRTFLSSVAALPALPMLSSLQPPQAPPPAPLRGGLKLGTVTYNIAKDWDVPTIIKNLTEVGFDGVELRTTHKHGVEITLPAAARADVRKQFEASAVKIGGGGTTRGFHSPDSGVGRENSDEDHKGGKVVEGHRPPP